MNTEIPLNPTLSMVRPILVEPSSTTKIVSDQMSPTRIPEVESKVEKATGDVKESTPITSTTTSTEATAQSSNKENASTEDTIQPTGEISSSMGNNNIIIDQVPKQAAWPTTLEPMMSTAGEPKLVVLDPPSSSMSTDMSQDGSSQTSPMTSSTLRPSTLSTTAIPLQSSTEPTKIIDSPLKNFLHKADSFIERNLVSLKKLLTQ